VDLDLAPRTGDFAYTTLVAEVLAPEPRWLLSPPGMGTRFSGHRRGIGTLVRLQ
jgi:hypothetical protein